MLLCKQSVKFSFFAFLTPYKSYNKNNSLIIFEGDVIMNIEEEIIEFNEEMLNLKPNIDNDNN